MVCEHVIDRRWRTDGFVKSPAKNFLKVAAPYQAVSKDEFPDGCKKKKQKKNKKKTSGASGHVSVATPPPQQKHRPIKSPGDTVT